MTKASTFLPGATFKATAVERKGRELNPKCTRHLCPYELDEQEEPVCNLGCAWLRKGQ